MANWQTNHPLMDKIVRKRGNIVREIVNIARDSDKNYFKKKIQINHKGG